MKRFWAGCLSAAGLIFGQDVNLLPPVAPVRELRVGAGVDGPFWVSMAGRKLQGRRAHVLVEVDPGSRPVVPGLRLLEPLGGGRFYAVLALDSPLGAALLLREPSQGRAALTTSGLRGLRALEDADKLPLALPDYAYANENKTTAGFDLYFFADTDLAQAQTDLAQLGIAAETISEYFHRARIQADPVTLKRLAKLDWVQFIEPEPPARRMLSNRESGQLIQAADLQSEGFTLTGSGVPLGIIDGDVPAVHREFTGRLTAVDTRRNNSQGILHSTHVAGTMIAAGEFDTSLKGMAPQSPLFAWHYLGDTAAKMVAAADNSQVVAINNSWGFLANEELGNCTDFGAYGGAERDIDRIVREKNISIVFAGGNDRDEPICSLLPQAGFYSIARPATAKNIIAVGAVSQPAPISAFSAAGPTRDGRVKPELVARGVEIRSTNGTTGARVEQGTSMSAPAVTGIIALLAERYKTKKGGASPPPDLVKAVLINTAKDLGNPGPDYTYGFGLVQGVEAVKTIDEDRFVRDRSGTGSKTHGFEVPAGAAALRVALAYSDAPGAPGAEQTIVNHLDIELTGPDGKKYQPLGLDPRQPGENAVPRAGVRDNAKQVVVDAPAAGRWTVEVKAEVAEGEQDYAVTWTFAVNPAGPCTVTPSSTLELAEEKATVLTMHVNANNHCDAWDFANVPDWIRVVGAGRKGTGAVKLSLAENTGERTRSARLTVGSGTVLVRQNSRCTTPIAVGDTVSATLADADCLVEFPAALGPVFAYVRKYEFSGRQGQRVAMAMDSNVIDAYLMLVAPGNVTLAEDDDSGEGINARLPSLGGYYTLPYTGTYQIWASSALDLEVGPYTLRLEAGPDVPGGAITPVQIDACPSVQTGELSASSSGAGRRGDLFRTNVYQFFGRLGQDVTVEVREAAFDPFVYLISPSGSVAGTVTDDGSGARKGTFTLNRTGVHSLEVTSFSPFVTGGYALAVEGCSAR